MASNKVHDMMFKEMFSDPELTRVLMREILPAEMIKRMDMNSLKARKDTFITNEQSALYADLLFDVKMKNKEEGKVYLLFEHKSYSDSQVTLQLLSYMTEIWRSETSRKRKSLILPILISQGSKRWNQPTDLTEDLFDGYQDESLDLFHPYTPNFHYLLFDVQEKEAVNLIQHSFLRIVLEIFSLVHEEQLDKLESKLIELLTMNTIKDISDSYSEQVIRLLKYLLEGNRQFTKDSLNTINEQVESVRPEGSEMIMNLAEELRKEGRQEGQLQKSMQIFEKLKQRGESKETIMHLLDINECEYEQMEKLMK